MSRQIVALLLAPLVVPILLVPYAWSMSSTLTLVQFIIEIATIFGYGGMIVFGFPLYLLLRKRSWTSFWIAPLLGSLIGALMWIVFSVSFALALGEGAFGVRLALTDPDVLKGIAPGGALGAAVAVVFWLIARPDREGAGIELRHPPSNGALDLAEHRRSC